MGIHKTEAIRIDFSQINSYEDFYGQLRQKVGLLPEYFGNNLDALFDVITGYLPLPLYFELINIADQQIKQFDKLISTLEDAEIETDGDFMFFMFSV
jgi:ribonuclease inhibitor